MKTTPQRSPRFAAAVSLALSAGLLFLTATCDIGGGARNNPVDSGSSTYNPAVHMGAQTGTLVSGIAGSAAFAVTTTSIDSGSAGKITWYSDSAGATAAAALAGITASVTSVSNNAATVTMSAAASAVVGSYYFKLAEGSGLSSVATLAIAHSGAHGQPRRPL